MNRKLLACLLPLLSPLVVRSQVTIKGGDLFNQVGLYYRSYANRYDPFETSGSTAYSVPSDLIGDPGPGGFWDFSDGPTNKVLRFDYVSPTNVVVQAEEFPDAQFVEQMTDESDQSQGWLFLRQVPGEGRKVYGFYAQNSLFTPSNVFVPPIVDFPDPITYGLEWSTSTTYENTLSINDPDPEEGGIFDFAQQTTLSSKFKADAYGTIVLPDEFGAFGEGIRINEEVTIEVAVDFGEGFQTLETDYTRNYYWLMPGKGIVAQLNSRQSSSPPPEKFSSAIAFLRMFETNKKDSSTGGCTSPQPVTDLRLRISNGVILLTWTKADCATQYVVEYSPTPSIAASWKALGDATTRTVWQGENTGGAALRFYRVVSLK